MSLYQTLNSPQAANTILMVSAADLRDFADRVVAETIRAVEEQHRPVYMTREDVMSLLHISNGTFYNYISNGKIKPVKVGDKKLFIRAEIDEALRNGSLRQK